jgi:hypothetical protein
MDYNGSGAWVPFMQLLKITEIMYLGTVLHFTIIMNFWNL